MVQVTTQNQEPQVPIPLPCILVVDDDPAIRTLLIYTIKSHYEVITAENGHEALAMLKSDDAEIDVVLMDIMMPQINGLETLKKIRADSEIANTPVILVSALTHNEDVVAGLKLGANDYITKPFDRQVLLARIKTQVELKRLMDERRRTIEELKSAQTTRDNLFRVVSHDLKNPVANIVMAEAVLREQLANDPLGIQVMDTVKSALNTMQEVIEDFLDVVILQSGKFDLRYETASMEAVMCNAILQFSMGAEEKNITINMDKVDGTVWADEGKLQQVVSNLLSNAIKYSPNNSTITVWTENIGDDSLRLYVGDEGSGIPEAERHLLFTEFGKLTPRPTGEESSTGLGLWIVKTLTEMMNGKVGTQFPDDGGSVFWIEFPTTEPTEQGTTSPAKVAVIS